MAKKRRSKRTRATSTGARRHSASTTSGAWTTPIICFLLVVLTWIVFGQTLGFEFVNYDDQSYVYENPMVNHGLNLKGISWAFSHTHSGNWHPLTWISHTLDCQIFGLNSSGHHFTNVLFHSIAVLLLFLVLYRMTGGPSRTGSVWRSAFVAAAFAIHPLRVESVAWVAERKDVLSAIFLCLTIGAYWRYVRQRSIGNYLLLLGVFALGLLSKPMLVTVPFILLLLDYWPLDRFKERPLASVVLEKMPLLLLSAISCFVTYFSQKDALSSFVALPFSLRAVNALTAYFIYLRQLVWPVGLAPFYPYPGTSPTIAAVFLLALLFISITAGVIFLRRSCRYLLVGWLWYVGMLVPVIGLIQVGEQSHADRYTYLPQIGLFIAIAWGAFDLSAILSQRRALLTAAGVAVIGAMSIASFNYAPNWRDSEAVWSRSILITDDNPVAHRSLGGVLFYKGQTQDALREYQTVLRELEPENASNSLAGKDQRGLAVARYQAHVGLANALLQMGRIDEAMSHYLQADSLVAPDAQASTGLGTIYLSRGEEKKALENLEKAASIAPDSVLTQNNLAWLLATSRDRSLRNGSKAVALARHAAELDKENSVTVLRTLAAAYAENGQFAEAASSADKARELAEKSGDDAAAKALMREGAIYRAHSSSGAIR